MNENQFAKLRLIYKITLYIADVRQQLVKDLVAYVDDSLRYNRRMRFLIQLADYEHQLFIKLKDIDTDSVHFGEDMLKQLRDEVDLITNSSS